MQEKEFVKQMKALVEKDLSKIKILDTSLANVLHVATGGKQRLFLDVSHNSYGRLARYSVVETYQLFKKSGAEKVKESTDCRVFSKAVAGDLERLLLVAALKLNDSKLAKLESPYPYNCLKESLDEEDEEMDR